MSNICIEYENIQRQGKEPRNNRLIVRFIKVSIAHSWMSFWYALDISENLFKYTCMPYTCNLSGIYLHYFRLMPGTNYIEGKVSDARKHTIKFSYNSHVIWHPSFPDIFLYRWNLINPWYIPRCIHRGIFDAIAEKQAAYLKSILAWQ